MPLLNKSIEGPESNDFHYIGDVVACSSYQKPLGHVVNINESLWVLDECHNPSLSEATITGILIFMKVK